MAMPLVQEKLMEFRLQLIIAAVAAIIVISLLSMGPRLATVVSFFWPLLVSTGFFLVSVAVLLKISPPSDGSCGEELMDYVESRHEEVMESGASEAREHEKNGDDGNEVKKLQ